jgi:hypothetical protein
MSHNVGLLGEFVDVNIGRKTIKRVVWFIERRSVSWGSGLAPKKKYLNIRFCGVGELDIQNI